MPTRPVFRSLIAGALASMLGLTAHAQDIDLNAWSIAAAKGAFDLCRADQPDADRVADHGAVWGWPRFVPYLEHPKGYRREAGGESRRSATAGDQTATVEVGVQSGHVTAAAPAVVGYFRCNVAVNLPVNPALEAYFTQAYGPPISKSDDATVWLVGQGGVTATPDAAASDDTALAPVTAGAVGASILRIELTSFNGRDRAKMTLLRREAAP